MKILRDSVTYFFIAWGIGNALLLLVFYNREQQFLADDLIDGALLLGFITALFSAPLMLPTFLFFWLINKQDISPSTRIALTSAFGLMMSYTWAQVLIQTFSKDLPGTLEFFLPFIVGAVSSGPVSFLLSKTFKRHVATNGTFEF